MIPETRGNRLSAHLRRLENAVFQVRIQLAEELKRVWGSCAHDFKDVMRWSDFYCNRVGESEGQHVLAGRMCKKCGLFEPRPMGFPWEICRKCGEKMGPIQRAGVIFFRVCPNCAHEYETRTEL